MSNANRWLQVGTIVLCLLVCTTCSTGKVEQEMMSKQDHIDALIEAGEFTAADKLIAEYLSAGTLPTDQQAYYSFQRERLDRVRNDFVATREEVWTYIQEYYPEVTDEDMERWERERSLEVMLLDGEKRYFEWAGRNLFRIDKEMKRIWTEAHPDDTITSGAGAGLDLDVHNAQIIEAAVSSKQLYVEPRRLSIKQSLSVDADAVPAGEIVRCWIPYPRLIPGRQEAITLLASAPNEHTLAPPDAMQRTIYFEKQGVAGVKTHFSVEYELSTHGVYQEIDPEQVTELKNRASLEEFLSEVEPHIVFTPALKELSASIVGDEQNPYRKAQLLFAWIDGNIPWASAREYSSIQCIPEYAYTNGHGDCGIQTLLFITLCRMNGIPARWQSGWELQPPKDSMHDWGMIYFEPFGWVPMDITYGLRKSEDNKLKWFYLSGMDSYRIIYNDDISQAFTPPKTHFRSETVDSQRGEAEWKGGNLYFDQWRWKFEWEVLEQ